MTLSQQSKRHMTCYFDQSHHPVRSERNANSGSSSDRLVVHPLLDLPCLNKYDRISMQIGVSLVRQFAAGTNRISTNHLGLTYTSSK